ncbi:hypothetical protein CK226_16055 [Mesorhizobium sp. WSM4311]|nr:hypothetical protein CK226_16055 [Mesorhizobium sp. WSM4311]
MTPDWIKRRDHVATYPAREAALDLVEWIKADDWESVSELDRRLAEIGITWTESFNAAAERCFEVYGYPELEAVAVARRVVEAFMRPSLPTARGRVTGGSSGLSGPTTQAGLSARPESPVTTTYGFTRRA